jgi:hypothetical protein
LLGKQQLFGGLPLGQREEEKLSESKSRFTLLYRLARLVGHRHGQEHCQSVSMPSDRQSCWNL